VVSRGGAGTANPGLDEAPLSTKLDKKDLDYLVEENLTALYGSSFWMQDVAPAAKPLVTVFPIRNDTSEHLNDQMNTLLSSIETSLVNSGEVGVVSRERQAEMIAEVGYQHGTAMDPKTAAKIGRQLGAKYYITGKLGAVDERLQKTRRLQYTLFIQVIDVETSLIKFQHEAARSKAIKG
jgi:PBP1b-binding outer membrane lipoprotein LpoB